MVLIGSNASYNLSSLRLCLSLSVRKGQKITCNVTETCGISRRHRLLTYYYVMHLLSNEIKILRIIDRGIEFYIKFLFAFVRIETDIYIYTNYYNLYAIIYRMW